MWRGFCGWSANNGPLFGGSRSVRVKLASENPPTPVGVLWDVFASRSRLLRSMTSTTMPFSNVVSKPTRPCPTCEPPALVPVPIHHQAGETRSQRSARRGGWGEALSFSTPPWQNGFQPPLTITPQCQRAAWEVREKSHTVMPERTEKTCWMQAYGFKEKDWEVDREDGKPVCFPVSFSSDLSQVVLDWGPSPWNSLLK